MAMLRFGETVIRPGSNNKIDQYPEDFGVRILKSMMLDGIKIIISQLEMV